MPSAQTMPQLLKITLIAVWVGVSAYALAPAYSQTQQNRIPRSSVSAGICTLSEYSDGPHPVQTIGYGFAYRFQWRTWLGAAFETATYPESHAYFGDVTAYGEQEGAALLLSGHRFGKLELLGEAGYGIQRTFVDDSTQVQQITVTRYYPEWLIGGRAAVRLTPRWGLEYEVRDNITHNGAFTDNLFQVVNPAHTANNFHARFGVSFYF